MKEIKSQKCRNQKRKGENLDAGFAGQKLAIKRHKNQAKMSTKTQVCCGTGKKRDDG